MMTCFTDRRFREASQRRSARDRHSKKFVATRKSTPSGSPRIVRRPRIRCQSGTDRGVDSRLPILAEGHQLKSDELGIDSNRMEAIDASMPRTRRGGPTGR